MRDYRQFYINGQWVTPQQAEELTVTNPATEKACATISLGSQQDLDHAVSAARGAFAQWSLESIEQRKSIFNNIITEYKNRYDDLATAISEEMGAPKQLASKAQVGSGLGHLKTAAKLLDHYAFTEQVGNSTIYREPIGVCGLITPWNWPLNQITCKVAPALATGCTMILKPSEIAPLSAYIFTEILHKAGVPKGVFNLINGDGAGIGTAIAQHPDIDLVSFTGSTRAGALVAQNAAPTIKRVSQELGGKSPNILLDDAQFASAVKRGAFAVFNNTGQSCNAPTRMLVPKSRMDEAAKIAQQAAERVVVGDPANEATTMGPLVSAQQYEKVINLIQQGIEEGAQLICGGTDKPQNLQAGYFVKPTVFANVANSMTIAREEIFGPVLSILGYDSIDQAIDIANDTPYGLAAYIQGENSETVAAIARRLRAGNISINGQSGDLMTPFGGFKQSGNGREWGAFGFDEFVELKAVSGLG